MEAIQPTDASQLQTELDALYQQRAAIWDAAYQQIKATEAQQKVQERLIQERRQAAQSAIDESIDARVQAYTGRVGIHVGDVVRFISDYGDAKRGALGQVTSVSDERAAVEDRSGAMATTTYALALVIDPNLRDAFKLDLLTYEFLSAARYGYFDAPNSLEKLQEAQELIAGMIQRLGGAS